MEQQLTCRVLPVLNCNVQHQRYFALYTWVLYFPKLTWPSGYNLSYYFDKVIANASSITTRPNSKFQQVYFLINGHTFEVNSYKNGRKYLNEKATNVSLNCLDSNDLEIKCLPKVVNDRNSYFSSINVTFYFSKLNSYTFRFVSFNTSEFKNGYICLFCKSLNMLMKK